MEQDEKYKPTFEMFYNIPYKAYCGKCERMIAEAGKYRTIKDWKENKKTCKHCGALIDWEVEK